jgi:hypothetical protein
MSDDSMQAAVCEQCEERFHFVMTGRRRTLCNACRTQRERARQQSRKKKWATGAAEELRHNSPDLDRMGIRTLADVARIIGVSRHQAREHERNALRKIRSHRELRELFREYCEAGGVGLAMHTPDVGEFLVEATREVAVWTRLHERLRTAECPEEAAEVMAEIIAIRKQLNRLLPLHHA